MREVLADHIKECQSQGQTVSAELQQFADQWKKDRPAALAEVARDDQEAAKLEQVRGCMNAATRKIADSIGPGNLLIINRKPTSKSKGQAPRVLGLLDARRESFDVGE